MEERLDRGGGVGVQALPPARGGAVLVADDLDEPVGRLLRGLPLDRGFLVRVVDVGGGGRALRAGRGRPRSGRAGRAGGPARSENATALARVSASTVPSVSIASIVSATTRAWAKVAAPAASRSAASGCASSSSATLTCSRAAGPLIRAVCANHDAVVRAFSWARSPRTSAWASRDGADRDQPGLGRGDRVQRGPGVLIREQLTRSRPGPAAVASPVVAACRPASSGCPLASPSSRARLIHDPTLEARSDSARQPGTRCGQRASGPHLWTTGPAKRA